MAIDRMGRPVSEGRRGKQLLSVQSDTNSASLASIRPYYNYGKDLDPIIVYTHISQVVIYTSGWTEATGREWNWPIFIRMWVPSIESVRPSTATL